MIILLQAVKLGLPRVCKLQVIFLEFRSHTHFIGMSSTNHCLLFFFFNPPSSLLQLQFYFNANLLRQLFIYFLFFLIQTAQNLENCFRSMWRNIISSSSSRSSLLWNMIHQGHQRKAKLGTCWRRSSQRKRMLRKVILKTLKEIGSSRSLHG